MKTKTNLKKKMLIAPTVLLFVLFFNLSVEINNDGSIKLFPVASACHKTYTLSGYEWTDIRASEEPCNTYCESKGYDKGMVTASGDKTCAGAECSYISDFATGEQSKIHNDGHCGCNSQFTCACGNNEIKKPDLIVKDTHIEPKNPTTNDIICLYATIKNIGTEDVKLHDLTSWTYVNETHAANTFYGKNISVGEKITKEVFCSKYGGDNAWLKKGKNTVKVEIDPASINIVDESNENNNEKTISFTITESVPETICGNGICEEGETLENCAKDCNEIYPSESDVDYCVSSAGKKYPTTGEGNATWFLWNGCSKYKVYNVKSNKQINMKITGDSCSSCVCYSPSFVIYEYDSQTGDWIKTKEYTKPGYRGYSDDLLYTPKSSKIKVVASRCFYLRVYGETVENENKWDISIKFDKAHKASFYPFLKTEGETGKTYYAKLNKSDDLYEEYVGGECCDYSSNPYYYNKCEEEQCKRAKGWYAERKRISDDKYKVLIRGIAWADCTYSGYGYAKGELNLNSDSGWKISEVVKCGVSGSNKDQETYCETGDKFVKFAAGSTCGGCCACADSGSVDIEIIVEKSNSSQSNQIKVISPNGGEIYERGQTIEIKFLNSITDKTDVAIIHPDGPNYGMAWITSENKNIEQTVKWNIPENIMLGKYKIKISAIDKEYSKLVRGEDFSNDSFSIISSNNDTCLPDGTLIKLPNNPRIFVIKNCKKQWIRTAEEFENSGYKWSDIKDTSKEVVDAYADYFESTTKLLRAAGHNKVYRVINGKRLWIPTVSAFNSQGLKWDDVQNTDETEIDKYPKIKLIKGEGDDRIFYITNSGMKKHLINTEVFNFYDENKNLEVVKVSPIVINSFRTVNLFKDKNGNKVYKIEGNKKKWIKSAEVFKKHNFDWNKIVPVNYIELNAYKDDGVIE